MKFSDFLVVQSNLIFYHKQRRIDICKNKTLQHGCLHKLGTVCPQIAISKSKKMTTKHQICWYIPINCRLNANSLLLKPPYILVGYPLANQYRIYRHVNPKVSLGKQSLKLNPWFSKSMWIGWQVAIPFSNIKPTSAGKVDTWYLVWICFIMWFCGILFSSNPKWYNLTFFRCPPEQIPTVEVLTLHPQWSACGEEIGLRYVILSDALWWLMLHVLI